MSPPNGLSRNTDYMNNTLPDLENGYMVMGYNQANRWQTNIESVLAKKDSNGDSQYAYMSHECRGEDVSPNIFGSRNYEFLVIKTWKGNYNLRSGSYNFGFNPFQNFAKRSPLTVYEKTEAEVVVRCDNREASYLSVDETLDMLQHETPNKNNKLYMEVSYFLNGSNYIVYAPCRYTNFPNPNNNDGKYIQPISGYILFEDEERFHTSYLAIHVTDQGTCPFSSAGVQ